MKKYKLLGWVQPIDVLEGRLNINFPIVVEPMDEIELDENGDCVVMLKVPYPRIPNVYVYPLLQRFIYEEI